MHMRTVIAGALALGGACAEPAQGPEWPKTYVCGGVPDLQGLLSYGTPYEASGPSTLLDIAAHELGATAILGVATSPIEFGHAAVPVGAEPTLFTAPLYSDGTWPAAVLTGRQFDRGELLAFGAGDGWFIAATTVGDVTMQQGGGTKRVELPDDDASVVVLRGAPHGRPEGPPTGMYMTTIVSGDIDPTRLLMTTGPDGGVVLAGVAASRLAVTDVWPGGSLEARSFERASWPGHAWVAVLDRLGHPVSVTLLDGDAGTVITGAAVLENGEVAIAGRFGGLGRRSARFGQSGPVPVLESISGEQEAAFDGFVAVLTPTGDVRWAERIQSSNQDDPIVIAAMPGGFMTHVVTARGDTVYGDAGGEPVRVAASHSLAVWDGAGPTLRWAKATADYRMVGPGHAVRQRLAPGTESWSVLHLGDDGEVLELDGVSVEPVDDRPVFEKMTMACGGPGWWLAGSPTGRPRLPSEGPVLEYDVAEPHIVVAPVH